MRGGAPGFELDGADFGRGTPRNALILATSEDLQKTIEDVRVGYMPLSIHYWPPKGGSSARADVVFFDTPKGGAVFSTGSIAWRSSTLENDFDNDISTIARNVVNRFLDPTPFPLVEESMVKNVDRRLPDPEYDNPVQTKK